jgi:RNA polymerase sigma-70 factor (ECF subfamily)
VRAVKADTSGEITIAWLIVVARRRLVDHWRHQAVEDRHLQRVGEATPDSVDPWDDHLDVVRTRAALDRLGPHHRAALTLRYLDGLPVAEVAENLGRGLHADRGAAPARARAALRVAYVEEGPMPADPLDQLRLPVAPLAPRALFAADLRRRLLAELAPVLPDRLQEDPT